MATAIETIKGLISWIGEHQKNGTEVVSLRIGAFYWATMSVIKGVAILAVCLGLPISLIVHKNHEAK